MSRKLKADIKDIKLNFQNTIPPKKKKNKLVVTY